MKSLLLLILVILLNLSNAFKFPITNFALKSNSKISTTTPQIQNTKIRSQLFMVSSGPVVDQTLSTSNEPSFIKRLNIYDIYNLLEKRIKITIL